MLVRLRFDELDVDADAVADFLDAAFDDVRDSELPRDLRQLFRPGAISVRGSARNHLQVSDLGQAGNDFVLDAIGEIGVRLVFAEIFEWEHRNGAAARRLSRVLYRSGGSWTQQVKAEEQGRGGGEPDQAPEERPPH